MSREPDSDQDAAEIRRFQQPQHWKPKLPEPPRELVEAMKPYVNLNNFGGPPLHDIPREIRSDYSYQVLLAAFRAARAQVAQDRITASLARGAETGVPSLH